MFDFFKKNKNEKENSDLWSEKHWTSLNSELVWKLDQNHDKEQLIKDLKEHITTDIDRMRTDLDTYQSELQKIDMDFEESEDDEDDNIPLVMRKLWVKLIFLLSALISWMISDTENQDIEKMEALRLRLDQESWNSTTTMLEIIQSLEEQELSVSQNLQLTAAKKILHSIWLVDVEKGYLENKLTLIFDQLKNILEEYKSHKDMVISLKDISRYKRDLQKLSWIKDDEYNGEANIQERFVEGLLQDELAKYQSAYVDHVRSFNAHERHVKEIFITLFKQLQNFLVQDWDNVYNLEMQRNLQEQEYINHLDDSLKEKIPLYEALQKERKETIAEFLKTKDMIGIFLKEIPRDDFPELQIPYKKWQITKFLNEGADKLQNYATNLDNKIINLIEEQTFLAEKELRIKQGLEEQYQINQVFLKEIDDLWMNIWSLYDLYLERIEAVNQLPNTHRTWAVLSLYLNAHAWIIEYITTIDSRIRDIDLLSITVEDKEKKVEKMTQLFEERKGEIMQNCKTNNFDLSTYLYTLLILDAKRIELTLSRKSTLIKTHSWEIYIMQWWTMYDDFWSSFKKDISWLYLIDPKSEKGEEIIKEAMIEWEVDIQELYEMFFENIDEIW